MSYYREQLESFLSELDVKADTVLDIGGAQGEVKGRVKSWEVEDYQVLDLPSFDIQKPSMAKAVSKKTKADIIFCLEVFEYLIIPHKAFKSIKILLNKGGKAYVTFPLCYPHHNELELDSLRYTEPGIKRLADTAGLKITNTWYRRDKSGLLKTFYSTDGMRMAKQYPNHDVTGFIMELTK